MDLTDGYSVFHPVNAQYTFFSSVHENFFNIDDILGYKTSLKKSWNNPPHTVWPQCNKTRTQKQKEAAENTQTIEGWTTHCLMISGS
jgi:hypothetical protein